MAELVAKQVCKLRARITFLTWPRVNNAQSLSGHAFFILTQNVHLHHWAALLNREHILLAALVKK